MNQSKFIAEYNAKNRERFNEELFVRDDMEIIEELKNVILSSQRNSFFTIRVESFRVVDDYEEIINLLRDYNEKNKSRNKNRRKENIYDYINLKDSDIRLLIVRYFIAIKDKQEYLDVYIGVPRFVNKYYMRINGNYYSTMFQIVDGSTYNNLTSNSKFSSVTMKSMFMPIRIYRYSDIIGTIDNEELKCTYYVTRIFNKSIQGMKYFLAKFGLINTIQFLGIDNIKFSVNELRIDDFYTIKLNNEVYMIVPKEYINRDQMTQSLVYCIVKTIKKDVPLNRMFETDYWKCALGFDFNSFSIEKGESILNSLESIYDISTKKSIRLPDEYKKDIYDILRWMMREFGYLRQKDNLDIGYKKIRLAEYIASLYATKISKGIYRISDLKNRADILGIKKALLTHPTYLLSAIDKCNLINYKNMVNDMDSTVALKCTYKGISGLGEKGSNAIPDIYRAINISHIGRVDINSSSASDPGISGMLCPYVKIDNGYFNSFTEPNYWEDEFNQTKQLFKQASNMIEVLEFKKNILNEDVEEDLSIQRDVVAVMNSMINPVFFTDQKMKEDNKEYITDTGFYFETE